MSYILDALRRSQAERERERGQVPGLNTQPAPAEPAPRARAGRPALWLAAGLALGGVAAVAALWPRRAATPVPAAVATAAAPALAEPRAVAPPAAAPAALPVVVSAPPSPPPALSSPSSSLPAAPAPPAPAATSAALPPAAARVLAWAELTAEQKRELPPLVIGGSIWSDSALSRFVIFNGQVVREGELAAPGVTLERIAPKSALLRWRDLRIEVPL
jgi:general secretion pathway protein B